VPQTLLLLCDAANRRHHNGHHDVGLVALLGHPNGFAPGQQGLLGQGHYTPGKKLLTFSVLKVSHHIADDALPFKNRISIKFSFKEKHLTLSHFILTF
jgi:hypothetical protein